MMEIRKKLSLNGRSVTNEKETPILKFSGIGAELGQNHHLGTRSQLAQRRCIEARLALSTVSARPSMAPPC